MEFSRATYCIIAKVLLLDDPSYEALSYAWGDPKSTREVFLDGVSFQVTDNLEAALRHLRYLESRRVMWIDAICINQRDLSERCTQVSHTGSIYQKASEVIAWLGEEYEESDLVFDAFDVLLTGRNNVDYHWTRKKIDVIDNTKITEAINKFSQRPWWHQLWTFPEGVLCEYLLILCGKREENEKD